MENVKKELSNTQKVAINEIASRINEAATNWDDATIKALFEEFLSMKKGLEKDLQPYCNKVFFSNFDNLTIARIKVVTRINANKVTRSGETNKGIDNILSKSIEEQRKGVKSMLRNFVARNKGNKHNLHFSQSQYLTTFDNITNDEFKGLYRGATTIKVETVVSFVTGKLIEEEKKGLK